MRVAIAVCLVVAGAVLSGASRVSAAPDSPPGVYDSYFRRVDPADKGTLHLLISNPRTGAPLEAASVRVNGQEVKELPDAVTLWWRSAPVVVQPGGVMDVMVKCAADQTAPVALSVALSDGSELSASIPNQPPPVKLTYIGYDRPSGLIYLYLENTAARPSRISRLWHNEDEITTACLIPERTVPAASKGIVIYRPATYPAPGSFQAFKVLFDDGTTASGSSRAYAHFPILAWGGESRTELGFDPSDVALSYQDDSAQYALLRSEPAEMVYHLLNDPACADYDHGLALGTTASKVIARGADVYRGDPIHPSAVFACNSTKPADYFIYGETVDVLMANPMEMSRRQGQPLADAAFVAQAKRAAEPRPLWTFPEAFQERGPARWSKRLPLPAEERIMVYSAIGEGSKGIWYFARSFSTGVGYGASRPLEAEIGRINHELQQLRPYLVLGEPFPLSSATDPKVLTYSILCGDKAIVILVINADHHSDLTGKAKTKAFVYTPKTDFAVNSRVPRWLVVTGVFDVNGSAMTPLDYQVSGDRLSIPVDYLRITRQILVRTRSVAAVPSSP